MIKAANDGHRKAHPYGSEPDDQAGSHEGAARPAMNLKIARTKLLGELQRAQNHKKKPGDDVHQGQRAVGGEDVVQGARRQEVTREAGGIQEDERPARGDSDSDEGEEDDRGPEDFWSFASVFHNGPLDRAGQKNEVMSHSLSPMEIHRAGEKIALVSGG